MGFNTTIVILNDGLHVIEKHPEEFIKNLLQAMNEQWSSNEAVNVPCANHCNVAQVIEQHHADGTHLILTGGNYGTNVGYVGGYSHHNREDIKEMLKTALKRIDDEEKAERKAKKLAAEK